VICLDTNVISETLRKEPDRRVLEWLIKHDVEIALPVVTIAEIAFGIQKIRPDNRADRLTRGLDEWRHRFSDRILLLTEEAALTYGKIMGNTIRKGKPISAQDGMIAAIAIVNHHALATRNISDFQNIADLELINPWEPE
jgi:predicted nucleic acid-binding protein